jgi:hypothetical protein
MMLRLAAGELDIAQKTTPLLRHVARIGISLFRALDFLFRQEQSLFRPIGNLVVTA